MYSDHSNFVQLKNKVKDRTDAYAIIKQVDYAEAINGISELVSSESYQWVYEKIGP